MGLSHGLTCEAGYPRVTVRDRSSPRLMAADGPTVFGWPTPRKGLSLTSASAIDPTALAARSAAVPTGSAWTNVVDRSSLDGTAPW